MGDLGFLGVSYPEEYGAEAETILPPLFLPKRSLNAEPLVCDECLVQTDVASPALNAFGTHEQS